MPCLRYAFIIFSSLILISCSKESGKTSTFTLELPKSSSSLQKAGVSKMGVDCYAVNLTGPFIKSMVPSTCDNTEFGQFVGLVAAGQQISLTVEYGNNRTLDIYHIADQTSCNQIRREMGLGRLGSDKIHRIVHATGINFDTPEKTIEVTAEAMSEANSYEILNSLLPSCRSGGGSAPVYSGNPNLRLVLGATRDAATGSQIRIVEKQITIQSSGPKILPHQLGDN